MSSKYHKLFVFIVASLALPLIFQLATETIAAPSVTPPFHGNSIWNRPIGASPVVLSNSTQMIANLSNTVGTHINIDGIDGAWSVPVYYAGPGTPIKQVCDAAHYRPCEMVPVPNGLQPSPDADAKTVIVDTTTNPPRAWSFWLFTRGDGSNGDWTAGWGAFGWGDISATGDGIRNYDGGEWGGRVAGWNYIAGLIHPEEIAQGHIDHALAFFIPQWTAANTYVWPARGSDGSGGTGSNVIPVGSRIQLDPSVNVNTLPLSAGGKVIARALQVYGGWIADTGTAAAVDAREFVAVNGSGVPYVDNSPWAGLLTHMDLSGFPVNKLRIIQANPADFYQEGVVVPTATHSVTPTRTPTNTPNVGLPVSYPTVYDPLNIVSVDWKSTGSWRQRIEYAYNGTGMGWRTTGATRSVLTWNRLIDLSAVPNAYLWFQTKMLYGGNSSPAQIQVSLDGKNWTRVAKIPSAPTWRVPSINLSAYVGMRIQLRFVWDNGLQGDTWLVDDITVGSLAQGASMAGWDVIPTENVFLGEDNDTEPIAMPTQEARGVMPAPADIMPTLEVVDPQRPQETPFNPAPTQPPTGIAGLSLLESDSSSVSAESAWTPMTQPAGASGGSYLINTDPLGTLSVSFEGMTAAVAFVQGPSYGQFALEIDGAVQQIINANAPDYSFGQAILNGLSAGAHTLRVVPQAGVVAIDAFLVPAVVLNADAPIPAFDPAQVATALPTADSRFPTLSAPLPDAPVDIPPADATVVPYDTPVPTIDPGLPTPLPPDTVPISPDGDGAPISLDGR